jgi:hypothetical protein
VWAAYNSNMVAPVLLLLLACWRQAKSADRFWGQDFI